MMIRKRLRSPNALKSGAQRCRRKRRGHTRCPRARYFRTSSVCLAQPPLLASNAADRRASGIASNPDSTMVSNTPSAVSDRVNSTSVVGSLVVGDVRPDRERVPAVGESARRFDCDDLPGRLRPGMRPLHLRDLLVDGCRGDRRGDRRPGHERPVDADPNQRPNSSSR